MLRIETPGPVTVRWGVDERTGAREAESIDTGLGVWLADLDTAGQLAGREVVFTLFRRDAARWDDVTYRVTCVSRP
jgi:hypothetical protein